MSTRRSSGRLGAGHRSRDSSSGNQGGDGHGGDGAAAAAASAAPGQSTGEGTDGEPQPQPGVGSGGSALKSSRAGQGKAPGPSTPTAAGSGDGSGGGGDGGVRRSVRGQMPASDDAAVDGRELGSGGGNDGDQQPRQRQGLPADVGMGDGNAITVAVPEATAIAPTVPVPLETSIAPSSPTAPVRARRTTTTTSSANGTPKAASAHPPASSSAGTGTYANLQPSLDGSSHRASCHRCGNLRKKNVKCNSCPHIFCQRCAEKIVIEWGADVFCSGCPVCSHRCCCADARETEYCARLFHCYKKCPAQKNAGQTGGGEIMNTNTDKRPLVDPEDAPAIVVALLEGGGSGGQKKSATIGAAVGSRTNSGGGGNTSGASAAEAGQASSTGSSANPSAAAVAAAQQRRVAQLASKIAQITGGASGSDGPAAASTSLGGGQQQHAGDKRYRTRGRRVDVSGEIVAVGDDEEDDVEGGEGLGNDDDAGPRPSPSPSPSGSDTNDDTAAGGGGGGAGSGAAIDMEAYHRLVMSRGGKVAAGLTARPGLHVDEQTRTAAGIAGGGDLPTVEDAEASSALQAMAAGFSPGPVKAPSSASALAGALPAGHPVLAHKHRHHHKHITGRRVKSRQQQQQQAAGEDSSGGVLCAGAAMGQGDGSYDPSRMRDFRRGGVSASSIPEPQLRIPIPLASVGAGEGLDGFGTAGGSSLFPGGGNGIVGLYAYPGGRAVDGGGDGRPMLSLGPAVAQSGGAAVGRGAHPGLLQLPPAPSPMVSPGLDRLLGPSAAANMGDQMVGGAVQPGMSSGLTPLPSIATPHVQPLSSLGDGTGDGGAGVTAGDGGTMINAMMGRPGLAIGSIPFGLPFSQYSQPVGMTITAPGRGVAAGQQRIPLDTMASPGGPGGAAGMGLGYQLVHPQQQAQLMMMGALTPLLQRQAATAATIASAQASGLRSAGSSLSGGSSVISGGRSAYPSAGTSGRIGAGAPGSSGGDGHNVHMSTGSGNLTQFFREAFAINHGGAVGEASAAAHPQAAQADAAASVPSAAEAALAAGLTQARSQVTGDGGQPHSQSSSVASSANPAEPTALPPPPPFAFSPYRGVGITGYQMPLLSLSPYHSAGGGGGHGQVEAPGFRPPIQTLSGGDQSSSGRGHGNSGLPSSLTVMLAQQHVGGGSGSGSGGGAMTPGQVSVYGYTAPALGPAAAGYTAPALGPAAAGYTAPALGPAAAGGGLAQQLTSHDAGQQHISGLGHYTGTIHGQEFGGRSNASVTSTGSSNRHGQSGAPTGLRDVNHSNVESHEDRDEIFAGLDSLETPNPGAAAAKRDAFLTSHVPSHNHHGDGAQVARPGDPVASTLLRESDMT